MSSILQRFIMVLACISSGCTFAKKSASAPQNIPETGKTSHLFLSNADMFGGIEQIHKQIIDGIDEFERKTQVHLLIDEKIFDTAQTFYTSQFKNSPVKLKLHRMKQTANWTRDFLPELVINKEDKPNLIDFKYNRPDIENVEAFKSETSSLVQSILGIPLEKIDVNAEGGNILFGENKRLFTTKRIINNNQILVTSGALGKLLKQKLNFNDVRILETLPGEQTGHIDIFLKPIANKTLIILDSTHKDRKKYLNDIAAEMASEGYKIVKIPEAPYNYPGIVASYLNALIVGNTVFVPSYAATDATPNDPIFLADLEARKIYKGLGFNVVMIKGAAQFLPAGGSIHCLSKEYRLP